MGQISFDELLMGDSEIYTSPPSCGTSTPLHEKVKKLLLEGIESTNEICERLIAVGVISKERYSTGKPVSYGRICLILDEFVQTGLLNFVEDQNKKDRIYRLK